MGDINPLNAELNPTCNLLTLLAHHILHVSRIRVKFMCIMFKNSVPTSRRAQRLYFSDNLLILFEETVSACSENQYSLWTKCRFGFNVHRAIL